MPAEGAAPPRDEDATPLPSLDELLRESVVVAIPLRTRFRGIDVREAMLLRGPEGWTEFSPFTEYKPDEAATWLAAAIEFGWTPAPRPLVDSVEVNATLPQVQPSAAAVSAVLDRFDGATTVKVKVGGGAPLADDVARVRFVRQLRPTASIRVDANASWTVPEAVTALRALAPFGLTYVEQPCRTVSELVEVRTAVGGLVAIAADESIRRFGDVEEILARGAADTAVIKAQPLGGIRAALRVAARFSTPITVSSALDTSVGVSMGAHLAAALPAPRNAAGLGTVALLADDVTETPLVPQGGRIPVQRVEVSAEACERLAAPDARVAWWRERVAACWAVLDERRRTRGDG